MHGVEDFFCGGGTEGRVLGLGLGGTWGRVRGLGLGGTWGRELWPSFL